MRGDGRVLVRKGTSIPHISYCLNGKEKRESAGPTIQAEEARRRRPLTHEEALAVAHKLLQQRVREVRNDAEGIKPFVGPHQYKVTVGELLDSLEADLKVRQVGGLGASSVI